jgi:GH15 family glucan-1,4-alpha-glucosidase
MFLADQHGVQIAHQGWTAASDIIDWLCEHWDQPDEGIWETRGGRKNFTYGRFQAWVALDRSIRLAQQRGRPADIARWTAERDAIYRQIMERGWNPKVGAFTQHDAEVLDSSLLMMPLQGFHRTPRPDVAVHAGGDGPRAGLRQPGLPLQPERLA